MTTSSSSAVPARRRKISRPHRRPRLCVGYDRTLAGSPKAVFEPVNLAERETSTNGALLRPDVSLATLFQDPGTARDAAAWFKIDVGGQRVAQQTLLAHCWCGVVMGVRITTSKA